MIGVKDQNDRRDSWHHGGWGLKMIVWFLLVVLMFFVPNVIVSIYGILSKFGAGAFLLVQVVLLLDATHNWNDSWVEKDEKKWCAQHLFFAFANVFMPSKDMLPELKDKALKTIYFMLTSKSEQERKLLVSLVNKLGDPQNKSASNADYHLTNLLADHPNMKAVVIDEVDSFLFRPHLGLRAKYHAVNFLSQIRLSHKGDDPKVLTAEANRKQSADDKGAADKKNANPKDTKQETPSDILVELDSRILSALCNFIALRLYRSTYTLVLCYCRELIELFHMFPLTRLMILLNPRRQCFLNWYNPRILMWEFNHCCFLTKSHPRIRLSVTGFTDHRTQLLLPSAMNSSEAELFIGLLLRAMKNDINVKRVAAFSKRVLQVALQQPPQCACGCLFLLSEVLKARPPLWKNSHG